MLLRLDWVTQADSHSCGPLATAAALLLLQGFRPTVQSLRITSMGHIEANRAIVADVELRELRRRLLLIWFYCTTGRETAYT